MMIIINLSPLPSYPSISLSILPSLSFHPPILPIFQFSNLPKMLAAKRLPEVLRSVLSDGVEGAVVMTVEGSVMASEFISPPSSSPSSSSSAAAAGVNQLLNETSIAAISATIWNNCSLVYSGPNELNYHIMKFDKGKKSLLVSWLVS